MKDVRFYQELENKNLVGEIKKKNVIAVLEGTGHTSGGQYCFECISSLFAEPNSPVCGSSVAYTYLESHTRRISESKARELHPRLFERLDTD